jgi:glyoxylase-like metal-dependent hydrolase (beta-lactamase superfamily II)
MAKIFQYTLGISNGFFIFGDKGVIAVDTGLSEREEDFLAVCKKAGIKPTDIKLIIISHGHVDHFFNAVAMKKLTGAPLLCHRKASRFLMEGLSPDVRGRTAIGREILTRQAVEGDPCDHVPQVHPDIIIDCEYDLKPWGVDGKIIMTPGHSAGCMSVILDSGEALVGDIIAAPPETGIPGLAYFTYPGGTDQELFNSVNRILQQAKIIYSGHGGPFEHDVIVKAFEEEKRATGK